MPNRVLQGKSPPSIFSGIRGFSWAGFPLNAIVGHAFNARMVYACRNLKPSGPTTASGNRVTLIACSTRKGADYIFMLGKKDDKYCIESLS